MNKHLEAMVAAMLRARAICGYLYLKEHEEFVVPMGSALMRVNIFIGADDEDQTVSVVSNIAALTIAAIVELAGLGRAESLYLIGLAFDHVLAEAQTSLMACWTDLTCPPRPGVCIVCQATAIAAAATRRFED